MIGAIIGDIVGSPYEFNNIYVKNFPLFTHASRFTDDTVCTIALADAIMNEKDYVETLHEYYERYKNVGFGGMFIKWCESKDRKPYVSFGNGSAMRVSPVAWLFDTYDVINMARKSARVTHNHIEGIRGAEAIAVCIQLAKSNWRKEDITEAVQDLYYKHIPTLDEIEQQYNDLLVHDRKMLYSCQGSVPQAIRCFLDGDNFEDVIRTAVSIGGDSDTIACMAGSIAEAYYEIPEDLEIAALTYLDNDLKLIITQFNERMRKL